MKYIKTKDGSNTLYSNKYEQNFHNENDGAIFESLSKHVIPTFKIFKDEKELNILDICFGLGYNIFCTILYVLENNIKTKITFYSPEFDEELIALLDKFDYPKSFDKIRHIIDEVAKNKYYHDEQFTINIYIGDARKYIKYINSINVVYQDAFSWDVNKELWTSEYFDALRACMNDKSIVTTYSIATPIRLSLSRNGFSIYEHKYDGKRKATIAINNDNLKVNMDTKFIDMKKKILNNPNAKELFDTN